MSLNCKILGAAGSDNALLVQIDSGQALERLLFDCGEGCLSGLPFAEVLAIDHLFFSHLHMDHVAGFDSFFRGTFSRTTKPNRVWGPPGTARILQHRFQGFLWNLHEEMSAAWLVSDVHPDRVQTVRFELQEAFAVAHEEGAQPFARKLVEGAGFVVEAVTMDHRTPTLAYIVREKPRLNFDTSHLASRGLRPGPWLKQIKVSTEGPDKVVVDGVTYSVAELRKTLLVETPGESLAYLTDFLLDEPAIERLAAALNGCGTIVCEGQYRHTDLDLARKHFHMTTVLSATLAKRAGARELILIHLSDRYQAGEWTEMLREARGIFPNTRFPDGWGME